MNALDIYDFTADAVPTPPETKTPPAGTLASAASAAAAAEPPSLNEEVTQVLGQLGRFWGGVRKQSQSVIGTARKDFGDAVVQARAELGKLTADASATHPQSTGESGVESIPDSQSAQTRAADVIEGKGKAREIVPPGPSDSPTGAIAATTSVNSIASTASSFFSRFQSNIPSNLAPSNITQTIQKHLPPTLAQNAPQVDLQQLRTTLSSNIQRVQGMTLQQAEKLAGDYKNRGEALFKGAGEYLKDAVKVVPPEQAGSHDGIMWDGSDIWSFPSPVGTPGWGGNAAETEKDGSSASGPTGTPLARATRAEALLKRLNHDPEMLKLNPAVDDTVKAQFELFEKNVQAEGGIFGDKWVTKVQEALSQKDEDATALQKIFDTLVPGEVAQDTFWARYFFRVHQIEQEEVKRKALFEDATQSEDDFKWDDDDEAAPTSPPSVDAPILPSTPEKTEKPDIQTTPKSTSTLPLRTATSALRASATTSPHESEGSYDLVEPGKDGEGGGESEEDSDWE